MGPPNGGGFHALLWDGTPESVVDLNPAGYSGSHIYDASDDTQVGNAYHIASNHLSHALMWHGTVESIVDLHPVGFTRSSARSVFGNVQVACADVHNSRRAFLWRGSADSAVNLHPSGFVISDARGLTESIQVGFGWKTVEITHAPLWRGTAQSVVDLHPIGFDRSWANSAAGDIQTGYGAGGAAGPYSHALLWKGTAGSVVDLHSYLSDLPIELSSSYSGRIDSNGTIHGYGLHFDPETGGYLKIAVMWTPVPEPSTWTILCCGVIGAAVASRRSPPFLRSTYRS